MIETETTQDDQQELLKFALIGYRSEVAKMQCKIDTIMAKLRGPILPAAEPDPTPYKAPTVTFKDLESLWSPVPGKERHYSFGKALGKAIRQTGHKSETRKQFSAETRARMSRAQKHRFAAARKAQKAKA